jgi:hypothetical protein
MGDRKIARFAATKQYGKAFAKLSPKAQARVSRPWKTPLRTSTRRDSIFTG